MSTSSSINGTESAITSTVVSSTATSSLAELHPTKTRNKIELRIEDYKLEIEEIRNQIPENWTSKNKEFEIIQKAKNTQTKRYK